MQLAATVSDLWGSDVDGRPSGKPLRLDELARGFNLASNPKGGVVDSLISRPTPHACTPITHQLDQTVTDFHGQDSDQSADDDDDGDEPYSGHHRLVPQVLKPVGIVYPDYRLPGFRGGGTFIDS